MVARWWPGGSREGTEVELCQDKEEAGLGNWFDLGSKEREKGVESLGFLARVMGDRGTKLGLAWSMLGLRCLRIDPGGAL